MGQLNRCLGSSRIVYCEERWDARKTEIGGLAVHDGYEYDLSGSKRFSKKDSNSSTMVAQLAVIGAGWWGQGWHIPCLDRNPAAQLVAIVDQSEHPQSDMDPNLLPLTALEQRYPNTRVFRSLPAMLDAVGTQLDGVIVATPHATHYAIAQVLYEFADNNKSSSGNNNNNNHKPLHILMEKPVTVDMDDALALRQLVQQHEPQVQFWVNHSANFRPQAALARRALPSLGRLRHVTCAMASPVQWVFQNVQNAAWTQPSGTMLGNGFCWGQSCHLLGWIYYVCQDSLVPEKVFCAMNHEPTTGADMSHSATVLCHDNVVLNVSGTAWLPGSQYSEKAIGKQVRVQLYGDQGALLYEGDDENPASGRLEWRRQDGSVKVLSDSFLFEDASKAGHGADSVAHFVQMCDPEHDAEVENCANVLVGLRTVQTIEAMYRSHVTKTMVDIRNN